MLAWIQRSREARRRGCPVGTATTESEENDDWIPTDEPRQSEDSCCWALLERLDGEKTQELIQPSQR